MLKWVCKCCGASIIVQRYLDQREIANDVDQVEALCSGQILGPKLPHKSANTLAGQFCQVPALPGKPLACFQQYQVLISDTVGMPKWKYKICLVHVQQLPYQRFGNLDSEAQVWQRNRQCQYTSKSHHNSVLKQQLQLHDKVCKNLCIVAFNFLDPLHLPQILNQEDRCW